VIAWLKSDAGFRLGVVILLASLLVVEAARGIADSQRVVEVAGSVTVDGEVDANISNEPVSVQIDR